jgi:hypothetical protein
MPVFFIPRLKLPIFINLDHPDDSDISKADISKASVNTLSVQRAQNFMTAA